MQQKIDWQLADKNTVLIELKDVYCEYIKEQYLKFLEDDITNYIDIAKKKYKRTSNEYTMEIDFLKNICTFTFPTKESCSFDCNSEIEINENKIILEYSIADEVKKITINMKEE